MIQLLVTSFAFLLILERMRRLGQLRSYRCLAGIYMYLSYCLGCLSYFYFNYIFAWEESVFLSDVSTLWAEGVVAYLVTAAWAGERQPDGISQKFAYPSGVKRLAGGIYVASVATIGVSLAAFAQAGVIPALSQVVDEARSTLASSGVISYGVFWNSLALPCLVCLWRADHRKIARTVIVGLGTLHLLILLGFAMRNYLLIALILSLTFSAVAGSKPVAIKPILKWIPLILVVTALAGTARTGRSLSDVISLVTFFDLSSAESILALLLTSVFSEFRQWPAILSSDLLSNQDVRYLFVPLFSVIPSWLFALFGENKDDYAFSSGLLIRNILGLAWDGDNLGLRVTQFGDFYLSLGAIGFVAYGVLFAVLMTWIDQRLKLTPHLLTAWTMLALGLLFIMGFSSDLGTVTLKATFCILFFLMISSFNQLLDWLLSFPKEAYQ